MSRKDRRRLIPIGSARPLNRIDPCKVKGVLRYLELAHRCATELVFGQELRLIVLHESKKPIATTSPFFVGLFREFLLSILHYGHVRECGVEFVVRPQKTHQPCSPATKRLRRRELLGSSSARWRGMAQRRFYYLRASRIPLVSRFALLLARWHLKLTPRAFSGFHPSSCTNCSRRGHRWSRGHSPVSPDGPGPTAPASAGTGRDPARAPSPASAASALRG
jgi:hypothetical protein